MRGEVDVAVLASHANAVLLWSLKMCMCSLEHVSDSVFFPGSVSCISSALL